jgi:hypothetical protein
VRQVCHVRGVRFLAALASSAPFGVLALLLAVACSSGSSGSGDSGDASDEFPSCRGACDDAGSMCQGYSVQGYCAGYYCWQGSWVLSTGCPTGMTEAPSLTLSCGQACFGITICPYNNVPPATDVCCCPETDAPSD